MARSVSFCALFILVLGSIIAGAAAIALPPPMPVAAAQETTTAPHTAKWLWLPSPAVVGHDAFAQPTMAQLQPTEAGKITISPVHAFPVMLIAAMLMTCAAASIIARDRDRDHFID